jgi:uncharacterized membrane protein
VFTPSLAAGSVKNRLYRSFGVCPGVNAMQLVFLLLLLVVPYLLLTLAGQWMAGFSMAPTTRARVGLSLFFIFTALGHFIRTEEMSAMLPPVVHYRTEIIYLTGVLELLGAVGVWIPRLMRAAGLCLILMLVCVSPANIYSAIARIDFGGHAIGPAYLLMRLPFQLFVIGWTYMATEQRWLARRRKQL